MGIGVYRLFLEGFPVFEKPAYSANFGGKSGIRGFGCSRTGLSNKSLAAPSEEIEMRSRGDEVIEPLPSTYVCYSRFSHFFG